MGFVLYEGAGVEIVFSVVLLFGLVFMLFFYLGFYYPICIVLLVFAFEYDCGME